MNNEFNKHNGGKISMVELQTLYENGYDIMTDKKNVTWLHECHRESGDKTGIVAPNILMWNVLGQLCSGGQIYKLNL